MSRPKKDPEKVKSNAIRFRLTDEDLENLDSIVKELNSTRSRTLRVLIGEAKNILKL